MTLDELKKIAAARTKGPWEHSEGGYIDSGYCHVRYATSPPINYLNSKKRGTPTYFEDVSIYDAQIKADANFIAMAANHFDQLLAVVEAAKDFLSAQMYVDDSDQFLEAKALLTKAIADLENVK